MPEKESLQSALHEMREAVTVKKTDVFCRLKENRSSRAERFVAMQKGILYGVGVGPGDPELMTLKAVRIIKENAIIALPDKQPRQSAAYRIVAAAVPELAGKTLLALDFPMTKDEKKLERSRYMAASKVKSHLEKGQNVVFLTLGDISVYSTFSYLQAEVEKDGFTAEGISGVTSFSAAAAAAGIPLCRQDENIHILSSVLYRTPATPENGAGHDAPGDLPAKSLQDDPLHLTERLTDRSATYVLMKAGRQLGTIRDWCSASGWKIYAAENCGMPDERIYCGPEEIPDKAGYFTLVILKGR